jgi:hypothetical protein
MFNVV